jgi:hypothetical protein
MNPDIASPGAKDNPDTGAYDFIPGSGVGRPPVATGELAVLQRLMAELNGPKSLDEAMRLRTAARQSPQAAQRFDLAIDAEARHQAALEQQAFAADPTNIGKTFNVQAAEERRRQDLRNRLYGVPDGAPQSGTPPAPDNPSAKPQAANPTVAPAAAAPATAAVEPTRPQPCRRDPPIPRAAGCGATLRAICTTRPGRQSRPPRSRQSRARRNHRMMASGMSRMHRADGHELTDAA